MDRMLSVMAENPAAAGAGLFAMLCLAAWPLFRARSTMLLIYIGSNLGFAVHYALLDHWTAVVMSGLMGAQTLVAMALVRRPGFRWAYYAFMPFLAAGALMTWQGLPSLLSATATTLSTLGRMQRRETLLRVLLLASTPFWAAHDLLVGSLPGLLADLLSMATGATMLLRESPEIRATLAPAVRRRALRLEPVRHS
jgi:hypothetical protein